MGILVVIFSKLNKCKNLLIDALYHIPLIATNIKLYVFIFCNLCYTNISFTSICSSF